MKNIIFALLFVIACFGFSANGQSKRVQNFEGEIRFGLTTPLGNYHNDNKKIGGGLGLELRYNLPEQPWDIGFHLGLTTAVRSFVETDDDGSVWESGDQSNRSLNMMLVGDYNFRQGKRVNPFVGIGLGFSSLDCLEWTYPTEGSYAVIAPRIGVELLHHVRFTLTSHINRNGYNNLELSLGVVIGGRPKK